MKPLELSRLAVRLSALAALVGLLVELSFANDYWRWPATTLSAAFVFRVCLRLLAVAVLFGATDRVIAWFTRRRSGGDLTGLSLAEVGVVIVRLSACWLICYGLDGASVLPSVINSHRVLTSYYQLMVQLRPLLYLVVGVVFFLKTGQLMWLLSPPASAAEKTHSAPAPEHAAH